MMTVFMAMVIVGLSFTCGLVVGIVSTYEEYNK